MKAGLSNALSIVGAHLKEIAGFGGPSIEDFRAELAKLGLLDREFGPPEYASALEKHLGIRIVVEEFPDASLALAKREVLEEGTLAEVFYGDEQGEALVLVLESLRCRPWPAYELKVYHELSHLAAGHPVKAKAAANGIPSVRLPLDLRLARRPPVVRGTGKEIQRLEREVYESEARRRACWLVFAGTFPGRFERDGINRVT